MSGGELINAICGRKNKPGAVNRILFLILHLLMKTPDKKSLA